MKKYILLIIALLIVFTASSQIINQGFELSQDTTPSRPQVWEIQKTEGYTFALDTQIKYSGHQSLFINSLSTITADTYLPFSQTINIHTDRLKRITVTAYVKTKGVSGRAQLWCQIKDKNNEIIEVLGSGMQNSQMTGTNDWEKIHLNLAIDTDVTTLLLGGLLTGGGSVWYDDFAIEEFHEGLGEPSNEVFKYSRELINTVKKNAIYADSLDWNNIDEHIRTLSIGLKTIDDAQLIPGYLIRQLRKAGDKHSFLQSKTAAQTYAKQNSVAEQPKAKLLERNIGYISVPAFTSISDTAGVNFATRIQRLIQDIDTKQNVSGWIVDLRKNGGGNMYPMIAGLGPLTGDGNLGYFVHPKLKYNEAWFYEDGKSGSNNRVVVTVHDPYAIKNTNAKIAVLVGSSTGSSGEMTAICFIGKNDTKLFGQNTAGYVTANQAFKLSSGAYLYLATSYVSDRNNKKYMNNIQPDIYVKSNDDSTIDLTLASALDWLNH